MSLKHDDIESINDVMASSQADDSEIGARLRFAMGDRTPTEAARLCGVPRGSLTGYLAGKMPSAKALILLAHGLQVDPAWLATGEGAPELQGGDLVRVRRYDLQLAAGPGSWLERAEERDGLVFSRDYLARLGAPDGDGLFVLDVAGDSMEPTIRDGAVVLVDGRDPQLVDGIWAFALGDTLRVKRLRRGLRAIQIVSDNPAYPPEEIGVSDEASLRLIGRVRWVGQSL